MLLMMLGEPLYSMEEETPDLEEETTSSGLQRTGQSGPKLYVYFVTASTLLFLFFGVKLFLDLWIRRLKQVENASEAYTRMCFLASLGQAGPMAQETPLEFGTRLALAVPAQSNNISDVVQAYMNSQYSSRKELGETEKTALQKSWVKLCPFLLKQALRSKW